MPVKCEAEGAAGVDSSLAESRGAVYDGPFFTFRGKVIQQSPAEANLIREEAKKAFEDAALEARCDINESGNEEKDLWLWAKRKVGSEGDGSCVSRG